MGVIVDRENGSKNRAFFEFNGTGIAFVITD
jgi:hypothetical protein